MTDASFHSPTPDYAPDGIEDAHLPPEPEIDMGDVRIPGPGASFLEHLTFQEQVHGPLPITEQVVDDLLKYEPLPEAEAATKDLTSSAWLSGLWLRYLGKHDTLAGVARAIAFKIHHNLDHIPGTYRPVLDLTDWPFNLIDWDKAGQQLLTEGDIGTTIYWVADGHAFLSPRSTDEKDIAEDRHGRFYLPNPFEDRIF